MRHTLMVTIDMSSSSLPLPWVVGHNTGSLLPSCLRRDFGHAGSRPVTCDIICDTFCALSNCLGLSCWDVRPQVTYLVVSLLVP
jgi:hypothetical protein